MGGRVAGLRILTNEGNGQNLQLIAAHQRACTNGNCGFREGKVINGCNRPQLYSFQTLTAVKSMLSNGFHRYICQIKLLKAAKSKAAAILAVPAEIKFAETPGVKVFNNTVVDKEGMLSNANAGRFMTILLPPSEKSLKVTMKVHTTDKSLLGILHDNRWQKIKRANYGWGSKFDYMQTRTFTIPAERLKTKSELYFHKINKNPGEIKIKDMKIEVVK